MQNQAGRGRPPKQAEKAGQEGGKGQAGWQAAGPGWPYPLLPPLLTACPCALAVKYFECYPWRWVSQERYHQPIPVISSSNMGRLLGVGSLRKQAPSQGGFESHGLHFNSVMQRFKDTHGWKRCSEISQCTHTPLRRKLRPRAEKDSRKSRAQIRLLLQT